MRNIRVELMAAMDANRKSMGHLKAAEEQLQGMDYEVYKDRLKAEIDRNRIKIQEFPNRFGWLDSHGDVMPLNINMGLDFGFNEEPPVMVLKQGDHILYAIEMAFNNKHKETMHKIDKSFLDKLWAVEKLKATELGAEKFPVSMIYRDKELAKKMYPENLFEDKVPGYYIQKDCTTIKLIRISIAGNYDIIKFDRNGGADFMHLNEYNLHSFNNIMYVSPDLVTYTLQTVAKYKGFDKGVKVSRHGITPPMKDSVAFIPGGNEPASYTYDKDDDVLFVNGTLVYSKGIWADAILPSLDDIAEKAGVSVSYLRKLIGDEK